MVENFEQYSKMNENDSESLTGKIEADLSEKFFELSEGPDGSGENIGEWLANQIVSHVKSLTYGEYPEEDAREFLEDVKRGWEKSDFTI